MRERRLALASILVLVLAGCAAPANDVEPTQDARAVATATHALVGAVEPEGLEAPTFSLVGALFDTGPVGYGAGEPSVWAALDGTLYVAFAGCDGGRTPGLIGGACAHGVVYRSADAGATWERMNDAEGRLASDGEDANGDADVAVDAAGNVYVSNLGGGVYVQRLLAGASAWEEVADVVPEDAWADRQWMAAAGAGHLIVTWMGGPDRSERQVAITTTRDAGDTWDNVTYLSENIGWLGSVQFAPDGQRAFIPFTQPVEDLEPSVVIFGAKVFHLFVARTLDGGLTWDVVDTGVAVTTSTTGGHWSGVLMAPSLDVTGDGTLAYVWAEDVLDPTGRTSLGSVVKLTTSRDGGATWGEPVALTTSAQAIMPWVTGGAGDRIAVSYLASSIPGDSDYVGRWDVRALVADGLASGEIAVVDSLIEADVHQGGVCTRGGGCFLTGSDRALLDFFESDLTPDGRLVVAYGSDRATQGKTLDVRVAIQEGGSLLLARPETL